MDLDGPLVSLDALSEVGMIDLDQLVIYMQGEDVSFSLPLANVESCNNDPCDDSVVTLLPNDGPGSLDSNLLVTPTPGLTEGEGGPLEHHTGLVQLADGQLLYVTYTVDPLLEDQVAVEVPSQTMTTQVVEDGSTLLLPTELPEDGSTVLLPEDGSTVLLPEDGSTVLLPTEDAAPGYWRDMPLTEVGNGDPRKARQILGSDVTDNERLSFLDALLAQQEKRGCRKGPYTCKVCDASFARALQYYDHLNLHSGQYEWKCSMCDKTFANEYVLGQHRRQQHQQLRPHACPSCSAGFDSASQLMYHQRRIHWDEQPFSCEICGRGFFKRSDLIGHLRLHLGITTFTCKVCGKQFSHTSNLTRHERLHSGVKPYPCVVCGRRFVQLGCMRNHRQSHLADRTVPCPLCKKMFKKVDDVRKHVRCRHQDPQVQYKDLDRILKKKDGGYQARQFYCTVCGESFPQASLLREHEAQHEKENHLQCFSCDQVYEDLDSMKNHACLPSKPQEAAATGDDSEELARQLQLLLHGGVAGGDIVVYVTREGQAEPTQVLIKPIVDNVDPVPLGVPLDGCEADNGQVDVVLTLDSVKPVNEVLIQPIVDDVDPVPLGVPLDGGEADDGQVDVILTLDVDGVEPINEETEVLLYDGPLQDLDPLQEQENSGSDDVAAQDEGPPGEPITNPRDEMHRTPRRPRTYQCPDCPKVFNHKFNYKQHLGTHYVDKQMYACTVCHQSFAWRSTLNKHMLSHGGQPPPRYTCGLCGKQYGTNTLMSEHLKRDHDKQRNHECEVCDKAFYKNYDLKIHKRTHTREKPYKCKTCLKTFTHASHIIRHERIHSGVRPYTCNACGRSFIESSLLRLHRSTKCTRKKATPCSKAGMKVTRSSAKARAT